MASRTSYVKKWTLFDEALTGANVSLNQCLEHGPETSDGSEKSQARVDGE